MLLKLGIRRGYKVVDFSCGSGNYTVPAAFIVGHKGVVYAIDKEECDYWYGGCLRELRLRVRSYKLDNVIIIKVNSLDIPLSDLSVDVVLLFDVLHSYYFPQSYERIRVLREVKRILRCNGYLLFYPGDPEVFGNKEELRVIIEEILSTDFKLDKIFKEMLIHEGSYVRGAIYRFIKQC